MIKPAPLFLKTKIMKTFKEKKPRLIQWSNDGYPPMKIHEEIDAVLELINSYKKIESQNKDLLVALKKVDKAIDAMKLNDRFGHTQFYIKEAINKAL